MDNDGQQSALLHAFPDAVFFCDSYDRNLSGECPANVFWGLGGFLGKSKGCQEEIDHTYLVKAMAKTFPDLWPLSTG